MVVSDIIDKGHVIRDRFVANGIHVHNQSPVFSLATLIIISSF